MATPKLKLLSTELQAIKEPKSELMEVTSEDAWRWLDLNIKNRPLSEYNVIKYMQIIENDQWEVNGESIKFSREGKLIDGQHRLQAIYRSGKTVRVFVTSGLDPKCFHTLDMGRERKVADVLHVHGEINVNVLSATLRLITISDRYKGDFSKVDSFRGHITIQDLEKTLENNGALRKSVNQLANSPLKKLLPLSVASSLHYLFNKISTTSTAEFFDKFAKGIDLSENHPILMLREKLFQAQEARRGYATQRERLAWIIIAWNAFLEGKKLTSIKWELGMPYPMIEKKRAK